jgi:hypothetical protein
MICAIESQIHITKHHAVHFFRRLLREYSYCPKNLLNKRIMTGIVISEIPKLATMN